jgi:hypothetical protein
MTDLQLDRDLDLDPEQRYGMHGTRALGRAHPPDPRTALLSHRPPLGFPVGGNCPRAEWTMDEAPRRRVYPRWGRSYG